MLICIFGFCSEDNSFEPQIEDLAADKTRGGQDSQMSGFSHVWYVWKSPDWCTLVTLTPTLLTLWTLQSRPPSQLRGGITLACSSQDPIPSLLLPDTPQSPASGKWSPFCLYILKRSVSSAALPKTVPLFRTQRKSHSPFSKAFSDLSDHWRCWPSLHSYWSSVTST